jgi:hypothetical protein
VDLQRLVGDTAEFREDAPGVSAVAAAVEQLGTAADGATVFIGPLDEFHVAVGLSHRPDSSIAGCTARSW